MHGLAFARGQKDSATCQRLPRWAHDSATLVRRNRPFTFPVWPRRAAKTATIKPLGTWLKASTAKRFAAGKRDAPDLCTDFHSYHKIVALNKSSPLKISAEVCSELSRFRKDEHQV